MNARYFFTSLTRIADLPDMNFTVEPCPRVEWAMGDYVVAEVDAFPSRLPVEVRSGRMLEVTEGDLLIGVFGKRHATLEATGDWERIGTDGKMHVLTGAGLLGWCTSSSSMLPPLVSVTYRGHVYLEGRKATMQGFVKPIRPKTCQIPVVLIIGTSMSAGKTTVGRVLVRQLKKEGLKVLGMKMTGAGRYRDVLSLHDAGADYIFDFVDAGLPSTICDADTFRTAASHLIARMARTDADVAVIEVGASPLEPYNGKEAVNALKDNIRCVILCSSDPYAVVGVMTAFNTKPDLVSGLTTSTKAGIELVEKLSGVPAINVLNKKDHPRLMDLLREKLQLTNAE